VEHGRYYIVHRIVCGVCIQASHHITSHYHYTYLPTALTFHHTTLTLRLRTTQQGAGVHTLHRGIPCSIPGAVRYFCLVLSLSVCLSVCLVLCMCSVLFSYLFFCARSRILPGHGHRAQAMQVGIARCPVDSIIQSTGQL
jgi:hypothetical protein